MTVREAPAPAFDAALANITSGEAILTVALLASPRAGNVNGSN